ncbi:MAG: hypothetical protein Kow00105_03180 [Phycisphaeraceae bacterium]
MSTTIIRLEAGDFDEAMTFLNQVFGEHRPHDFANMLPSIYQPTDESMRCNYAVRDGGRLGAIVGVFPIRWQVGRQVLRIAGVGGVSVHPDSRGKGYMKLLMNHAIGEMRREGYDLSYLGGRRQRYAYFGYEVAGTVSRLHFNHDNIRHGLKNATVPDISLQPLTSPESHNSVLKALHDMQPARCERPPQTFHHYLASWHCHPMVAMDNRGQVVGYVACQPNDATVNEFMVQDADSACAVLKAWMQEQTSSVSVLMPPYGSEMLRRLNSLAETLVLEPCGNWQVFNWAKVVDALLGLRHAFTPLYLGRVVLRITDVGQSIKMVVDASGSHCRPTDDPPDLELDALTATKVLFGPGSPETVTQIPAGASLLTAWCPLPLYISTQDKV